MFAQSDLADESGPTRMPAMLAILRKNWLPLALVGLHALALALVGYFQINWSRLAGSTTGRLAGAALLLIAGGADLGLLSLWAAFARQRAISKALAVALCIFCWCGVYDPDIARMLRDWTYFWLIAEDYRYYTHYVGLAGLAVLTVSTAALALVAVRRRGGRFRRLSAEELRREAGYGQFQISHLLLLTAVMSLVLAFAVNGRPWLSRAVSMKWRFAAYAPFYSAEAVSFSAFSLAAMTLAATWASLGYGRPWLRLVMALATSAFTAAAWAYAFTSPRHEVHLFWNVACSSAVGLLQGAVVNASLLVVRRRGYRFAPALEEAAR